MPDLIGSSIDGWRVVSQIGEGSMGTVWDARKGRQRAALKLMRPDSAAEDSLPRFRREAKLLTKIKNPHVMRCYGLGEQQDGFLYLLLEYLDGGSLEELLERRGRLTIPQTVGAVRGVLTGLAAIHDQGVVHRDIKPANVLLDRDGAVKIADFGLARKGEASASLTATGTILGTPFYMAPEQCRGEELDGRLDLYAVGVLIYHLATGEPPYDGKNALAILQQHMTADVPDLRHKIPDAPQQLVEAIGVLMAKDRKDRPADARAALKLLQGLVAEDLPKGGIRATSTSARARAASPQRCGPTRASGTQVALAAGGSMRHRSSGARPALRAPKDVPPPPPLKPLPNVQPSRVVDVVAAVLIVLGVLAGVDYGLRKTQARDGLDEVQAVLEDVREGAAASGSQHAERADQALALTEQVRGIRPWLDQTIPLWTAVVVFLLLDRALARFTRLGLLGRIALGRRARRLIRQGEYHAAAKVYEQLGRRDKGGELLMKHEMPAAAAELFSDGAHFQRLGDALMAAGKQRDALIAYAWAGAKSPAADDEDAPSAGSGASSREQAEQLAREGKLDDAIAAHLQAGRRYDAADLLERAQRLTEARTALEEAYVAGGGRDYWHHTGKKGPVEQARPTLARRIARLCQKTGDLSAAASYLEKSGDLLEAADIYAELGEFQSRARCLLGGVPAEGKLAPHHQERVHEAGRSLAQVRDPSALELLQRVEAWGEAATLARELGDHRTAAELFAKANQFAEGAACAELAGDKEQAAELYVQAHNHARASELYEALGQLGEAADQARRAGSRERQATLLRKAKRWLDAARSYSELGQAEEALACLKSVKKRDADWEEARALVGDVHFKEGRHKEAKEAYAQGVPEVIHFREQVPAALNYVATLEALGEIKEAIEVLERVSSPELAPADMDQRRARLQSRLFLAGSEATSSASASSASSSAAASAASAGSKVAQGITKATDLVGTTQGNYELLRFVGQGSFAWVYEALDKQSGKTAAIKVLKPNLTGSSSPKRFLREGTSLAGLKNPHLVEIYDMGDVDGIYYLALEFVKGSTLKKLITDEAPFPYPKAARLGAQICEGLGAAHRKGVVHRDLKPANVLVTREKDAKVLDFGLARVFEEDAKSASAGYLGTPRYTSPEQARGEDVGEAADQYAAGLIVYEMLTGKLPFESNTSLGYLNLHATEAPTPLRQLRPEIPPELEAAVMKSLEKQPRDRHPDVGAFARALLRFTKRQAPPRKGPPRRRAPAGSRRPAPPRA